MGRNLSKVSAATDRLRREQPRLVLFRAAAAAELDPWEVLADAAMGRLEVCIWEEGLDSVRDLNTYPGPLVPPGLYRVNPSDVRRMHMARGPIAIKRLDEVEPIDDQEPWWLASPIDVPPDVLLVREVAWVGYLDSHRERPARRRKKEILAEQRAPAELGAALRYLCEKFPNRFTRGDPPRPNIKQLAEALLPYLSRPSGDASRGFGSRNLTDDLTAALTALERATAEGESGPN